MVFCSHILPLSCSHTYTHNVKKLLRYGKTYIEGKVFGCYFLPVHCVRGQIFHARKLHTKLDLWSGFTYIKLKVELYTCQHFIPKVYYIHVYVILWSMHNKWCVYGNPMPIYIHTHSLNIFIFIYLMFVHNILEFSFLKA